MCYIERTEVVVVAGKYSRVSSVFGVSHDGSHASEIATIAFDRFRMGFFQTGDGTKFQFGIPQVEN